MGDPAALQEAIQRARQLAAKIGHPPNKRGAEELTSNDGNRSESNSNQYQSSHKQDSGAGKQETVDYGAILKKARIERGESSPGSDNNDNNSNGGNNNNTDNKNTNMSSNGTSNNDNTSYGGYQTRNYNNSDSNNYYNNTSIGRADKSAGPVSYQHGPTTAAPLDIYSNLANPSGTTRLLPPSDQHPHTTSGSSDYGTVNQNKIDILIPQQVIGLVIGKGGENIKRIQNETGATVRVDPSTMDEQGNKMCNINGSADSVKRASTLVNDIIENALASKRPRAPIEGGDEYRLRIPAQRTGAIIGRGGDTIRTIKQQSGCDIELDKNAKDCGPDETVFIIRGTQERIQNARELIQAKLASGRGPPSSGGAQHTGGGGGQQRQKAVATGANAAPLASYNDYPSAYPGSWPQQQAGVGSGGATQGMPAAGQSQATSDSAAAWTAYYAQQAYYAQYQAHAQAIPSVAYPGQAALTVPTATNIPQQQQQKSTPSDTTASGTGQTSQQADYSAQWVEYYKAMGYPQKEAEAIIEQMKKQQQTTTQHKQ